MASPSLLPGGPSVFLTTLNYLKLDTLSLFPLREQPWGLPSVCSTQPKGRREGPLAICWPSWATTISRRVGAVKPVAYITQLAFSSQSTVWALKITRKQRSRPRDQSDRSPQSNCWLPSVEGLGLSCGCIVCTVTSNILPKSAGLASCQAFINAVGELTSAH